MNTPYTPENIYDKVDANNMCNFYNIMRIRDDLDFMNINDMIISIGFPDEIKF